MRSQEPGENHSGTRTNRTSGTSKLLLWVLVSLIAVVAVLLAVVLVLIVRSSGDGSGSLFDSSDSANAAPGSGPEYKGKRPADIGAYPGSPVSYNDIQFDASSVQYHESSTAFLMNSYCTTVTIVNNSDAPFSITHTDFGMRLPYGTSTTPNGLNDIDRLDPQTVPSGGSTTGSLCYQVPSVVGDDEDPTFSYIGDGLGGTRIGWATS